MNNIPERRKFPRAILFAEVVFRRKNSQDQDQVSITRNIGRGGMGIISSQKLEAGEVLDLNISLPQEEKAIVVSGKVVWVKEFTISESIQTKRYTVGVEFVGVEKTALDKIDSYITSHAKPKKI